MADIKELLQKAAAHLRSTSGVNDYPLSIKLDDAAESLGEPVAYEHVAECQYSGSFPCNPTCDDSGWCYRKCIAYSVQDQKTAGDSHHE